MDRDLVAHCWAVLRHYGNMSSATSMFVLDRAIRAEDREPHLLAAFGPGFFHLLHCAHPVNTRRGKSDPTMPTGRDNRASHCVAIIQDGLGSRARTRARMPPREKL